MVIVAGLISVRDPGTFSWGSAPVSEPPALNVPTFSAPLTLCLHERTSCCIPEYQGGRRPGP